MKYPNTMSSSTICTSCQREIHSHVQRWQDAGRATQFYTHLSLTCPVIAARNHVECLKAARTAGFPWDFIVYEYAAASGALECLQYAQDNGCPGLDDPIGLVEVTGIATTNNHLDCLKFFHELGSDITDNGYVGEAIRLNSIPMLKYLLKHGCKITATDIQDVSANPNSEIAHYLRARGLRIAQPLVLYRQPIRV